jgi:hypothetical protein
MSAKEARAKVAGVSNQLGIARINAITNMGKITESITVMQSLESQAPDALIAIQGLTQILRKIEETIAALEETQRDVDNYRWSL